MAAYASLVSLMHIIHQIDHHPSPPVSLDKQQAESLTQVVTFLQEFLEGYVSPFCYSDEPDPLEVRIVDAAYAAEDVIESHIVDSIHLATAAATQDGEETRSADFFKSLQRVIEDMGLIMKEVVETVGDIIKAADDPRDQMQGNNVASHGGAKSEMVGFDDVLLQLLDRLTGRDLNRRIIPITGMGGIGKTTLSQNAFQNKLVKEHFDVCLWATISQDHNILQTLREVMNQVGGGTSSKGVNELDKCGHLEKWTIPEDNSYFPLLERLCLMGFQKLEEIPPEVGEIPMLKSIELVHCSEMAVLSAKRIVEEQEDLHGEGQGGLHVRVYCRTKEQAQALQYLATPNFHVPLL